MAKLALFCFGLTLIMIMSVPIYGLEPESQVGRSFSDELNDLIVSLKKKNPGPEAATTLEAINRNILLADVSVVDDLKPFIPLIDGNFYDVLKEKISSGRSDFLQDLTQLNRLME